MKRLKQVFLMVDEDGNLSLWIASGGQYYPVEGDHADSGIFETIDSWLE